MAEMRGSPPSQSSPIRGEEVCFAAFRVREGGFGFFTSLRYVQNDSWRVRVSGDRAVREPPLQGTGMAPHHPWMPACAGKTVGMLRIGGLVC